MIRVVVFLVMLALIALGFAWLADRPGDVAVTWLGYHVETSVAVAVLALLLLVLILILLWTILRAVLRSPGHVSMFLRHRRAMRGYQAVSRGLIAIGSGDQRLAHRSADEAARLTPNDPLTLLLSAQSAQLSGDRVAAEHAFRAMTLREETKLLGLRGLYVEAQRRGDGESARRAAEQAAKAAPALPWAGQAVLDNRCAASDWAGALDALERMKPGLAKADYRRKRAVLLTARAQALDERERDVARGLALEAVKLAPDLVPAAALAGRRLAEAGEWRRARRILEAAWRASPHPDLAEAYADLRLGDSARDRLARMQKLAGLAPGQREGALAVARAALDAREFETARHALAPYISAPTRRVAALMAEIEETEHGDDGRVREWMNRAMRASGDPVWTADGVVSDHWLPVSANGRLDGYQWRVPLAEIGVSRPVIEVATPARPPVEKEPEPPPEADPLKNQVPGEDRTGELPTPDRLAQDGAPAVAPKAPATSAPKPADVSVRAAEPVIPLVHAPDDPGPEGAADGEPVPQPSDSPDAWHRIRQLFR
jgi:HemY protein